VLLLVAALAGSGTSLLRAQTPAPDTTQQNLPNLAPAAAPNFGVQPSARGSGAQPGSEPYFRPQSAGSNPFGVPRSLTATAPGGVKFQFVLPRLSFAAGNGGGFSSPLDSGGGSFSMAPSGGSSMHPAGNASDGTSGMFSGMGSQGSFGSMGSRGSGMSTGGMSVSVPLKTSMFGLNLSMRDTIGGSFSQGAESAPSGGSGFLGTTGESAAANFGSAAGGRAPGATGRGSGAKMTLQLKF